MKRILVPLDGSPRSLLALEQVKHMFSPKAFEIILLMVQENAGYGKTVADTYPERREMESKLNMYAGELEHYHVTVKTAFGKAGAKIIEAAKELAADMIVMTKSTKQGGSNVIGMTAAYVLRHASCNVLIVREEQERKHQVYRGLVYRRAEGVVNLRGQLTFKQSECILPSVKGHALYEFKITRGKIRFIHNSYNPTTAEWDLPPVSGQEEFVEMEEGDTVVLHVDATGEGPIADRIRIVNRNMKTEAVFSYRITIDREAYGLTES